MLLGFSSLIPRVLCPLSLPITPSPLPLLSDHALLGSTSQHLTWELARSHGFKPCTLRCVGSAPKPPEKLRLCVQPGAHVLASGLMHTCTYSKQNSSLPSFPVSPFPLMTIHLPLNKESCGSSALLLPFLHPCHPPHQQALPSLPKLVWHLQVPLSHLLPSHIPGSPMPPHELPTMPC